MYKNINQWVYIDFNWGDSLVELLNYYQIYKKFGVIASVGNNREEARKISEWINVQPFVQDIIMTNPILNTNYKNVIKNICNYYNIDINKVDTSKCLMSRCEYQVFSNSPKLIIPFEYTKKNYGISNIHEYILINPYSISSNKLSSHWPYWHKLLLYLFNNTPFKYILIGIFWDTSYDYNQHKNVINFLNNKDNIITGNCDIYNISNKVKYTITTFNSLSHWCINQNNSSTIFGLPASHSYFWKGTLQFKNKNIKFFPVTTNFIPGIYHILRDLETINE